MVLSFFGHKEKGRHHHHKKSTSSGKKPKPQEIPQQQITARPPSRPNAHFAQPVRPVAVASPPPYAVPRPIHSPPVSQSWSPPPSYQQHPQKQQHHQQYLQPYGPQRIHPQATTSQPYLPLPQPRPPANAPIPYHTPPPQHPSPNPYASRPAFHSATNLTTHIRPSTSPVPHLHPPAPPKPQFSGPTPGKLNGYVTTKPSGSTLSALTCPVKMASASITQLQDTLKNTVDSTAGYLSQADAWYEMVSGWLDEMITGMDKEEWREEGVMVATDRGINPKNMYAKVWRYQNSKIPPSMPPFKVYMETWPLLSMAATYSDRVYSPPSNRKERKMYIEGDSKLGTRQMYLKSVTNDNMKVIGVALRGTKRFGDWSVNLKNKPVSPEGFLDDPGNKCHAGFLENARNMIKPMAEHLRTLLSENPSRRSNCSLLLTGHSAGGAVAALLYAHMMSKNVSSELQRLTSSFKRVHCITFGTPPTSLLPLSKPHSHSRRYSKSLFFTFVNEGDPVARVDREMIGSLLTLYKKPAPKPGSRVRWPVPAGEMSLPGKIVVLRLKPGIEGAILGYKDIEAVQVEDRQIREVVYGDPLAHQMVLYERRIKELAAKAATEF